MNDAKLSRRAAMISLGGLSSLMLPAQDGTRYQVTVTNLTRGQRFTPILVVTHTSSFRLFEVGQPASAALRALAEEGDVMPFVTMLRNMPDQVGDVANSPPPPPLDRLIRPGGSVMVSVMGRGFFDHVSVAAMLIPTNDAFLALNGAPLPRGSNETIHLVPAYDSGTERNDETCGSIPGPGFVECATAGNPEGNGGGGQAGGGEGFIHIHNGMHGVGQMNRQMRDWRNPVARIRIRRA